MSVKLTCEEVRELLSPYIDNMLDDEQMLAVSDHLKLCDACYKEYDELYKITKLLEELPELELPATFDDSLRVAISKEAFPAATPLEKNVVPLKHKKSIGWKKLSSIAAIFVIGIFTLIMYNNSGDLIDNSELDEEETYMINSAPTQEEDTFESSDIFSSRKYASAAGIGDKNDDSSDNGSNYSNDSCNIDNVNNDNGNNASRSGENENVKGVTTPGGAILRTSLTVDSETDEQTIELADTLSQYLLMLDEELEGIEYEILDSVQEEEDLWIFQVKVTVIDNEGKETIQDRTYIGQDGTLTWIKD